MNQPSNSSPQDVFWSIPSVNQQERTIALQYISHLGSVVNNLQGQLNGVIEDRRGYILRQKEHLTRIDSLLDDALYCVNCIKSTEFNDTLKDLKKTLNEAIKVVAKAAF